MTEDERHLATGFIGKQKLMIQSKRKSTNKGKMEIYTKQRGLWRKY